MLGNTIRDPHKIEGNVTEIPGLGLLNVSTIMHPEKKLQNVTGKHIKSGTEISGYEMHIGKTFGPDCNNPLLLIDGKGYGAVGKNNKIWGCYLHGMFASDSFRREFLPVRMHQSGRSQRRARRHQSSGASRMCFRPRQKREPKPTVGEPRLDTPDLADRRETSSADSRLSLESHRPQAPYARRRPGQALSRSP